VTDTHTATQTLRQSTASSGKNLDRISQCKKWRQKSEKRREKIPRHRVPHLSASVVMSSIYYDHYLYLLPFLNRQPSFVLECDGSVDTSGPPGSSSTPLLEVLITYREIRPSQRLRCWREHIQSEHYDSRAVHTPGPSSRDYGSLEAPSAM